MITTVLLLSFMLHIGTFFAIYQLYIQTQSLKKQTSHDVLELLDVYLQEIKDENEKLKQQLETKPQSNEQARQEENISQHEPATEIPTHLSEPEANITDTFEHSLQAEVLHLHSRGVDTTDIAKQLNCGKTEAELIIKIHHT